MADLRHHCSVELFEGLPLFDVFVQTKVFEEIVENHTPGHQVALPRVVSLAVNAVHFPEKLFEAAQQNVVHAV